MRRLVLVLCLATVGLLAGEALAKRPPMDVILIPVGTFDTGIFDEGAAEIVDYHAASRRLLVVNGADVTIDVLDIEAIGKPKPLFQIALPGSPTSVAVHPSLELIAVAVKGEEETDDGTAEFFNINGEFLGSVGVGACPDMLTWTPDGTRALVANEGQPSDDYTIDPEGSVSIITLAEGDSPEEKVAGATVQTARFDDDVPVDPGVRIFGPEATVAQDLEPEYVAVSEDSQTAWVTCQENNAIARLDVPGAEFDWVRSLGYKDHLLEGNALDASDKDDAIKIRNWPAKGMYQPDAVAAYTVGGEVFLVTANEGDARDYDGFSEEARVKDLTLDPDAFPDWEELQEKKNLGRLKITTAQGDVDGDGDFDELYCYGARSFSIWDADGNLVSDSGEQFEQITAARIPDFFNATNDEHNFDNRSDDKGPEPEAVALGRIGDSTIAFIGLERIGGIMIYDVSNPFSPRFIDYVNNRDFDRDPEADDGVTNRKVGDLGPEGLKFIPAEKNPTDRPLLVVANEISGTTTIFLVVTPRAEGDDHDD